MLSYISSARFRDPLSLTGSHRLAFIIQALRAGRALSLGRGGLSDKRRDLSFSRSSLIATPDSHDTYMNKCMDRYMYR